MPLEPSADGKYIWGSNSFVVNNLIVVALAYDFTKQQKYLDGVATGMDYLLGSQPARPVVRHRLRREAAREPAPPILGASGERQVSQGAARVLCRGARTRARRSVLEGGGPEGLRAAEVLRGPHRGLRVNEITINWNAPLAWVAAWLDEKARQVAGRKKRAHEVRTFRRQNREYVITTPKTPYPWINYLGTESFFGWSRTRRAAIASTATRGCAG